MESVAFGFVRSEIVEGLKTYGNWKIRQGAMDALLAAVQETNFDDGVAIDVSQFLEFLFALMNDPNFKIKQGSIQTMTLFLQKIDKGIERHLSDLVPQLILLLSDPKEYVREGCVGIFTVILEILGPIKLLFVLKYRMTDTNYRTREEIVQLYITIVLKSLERDEKGDSIGQYLMTLAVDAFKEALLDKERRVAAYAMEGLRLLDAYMSPAEFNALLLEGGKLSSDQVERVKHNCRREDQRAYLDKAGCLFVKVADEKCVDFDISFSSAGPSASTAIDTDRPTAIGSSIDGQSTICGRNEIGEVDRERLQSTIDFHQRASLRSFRISDHDPIARTSSDGNEIAISTTFHRTDRERPSAEESTADINTEHLSTTDQKFYRRLFQKSFKQLRKQSNTTSLNIRRPRSRQEDSPTVATRDGEQIRDIDPTIDRIARLIRRREEPLTASELPTPSNSASLAMKKREQLHVLKMKQKDRRTHSANAVLQRNNPTSRETLPSIHTKSRLPDAQSLKRAKAFDDGHSQDLDRERFTTASPPLDEDDGYPVPISSPGSTAHTRPGTLASGVSTLPKSTAVDVTTTEPYIDPDAVIVSVIDRLKLANNARKKEVDWISQAEALNDARRLVYHHPTLVKKWKRDLVMAFVPAMQQLRSTTARTAITLCQDIFEALGDSLEHEIDDVVPVLLRKAGETSNSGRDTFLASEADKALSVMIRNVNLTRSLSTLLQHSNNASKYVRSKAAAHLDDGLEFAASKLKASAHLSLIDRVFKVAVGFLEEGLQLTRTYGKRLLWTLQAWINNRGAFDRLMGQLETDTKTRRVREVLQSTDGPPPLPNKTQTTQGQRRSNGNALSPLTPSLVPPERVEQIHQITATCGDGDSPREAHSGIGSDVQVCTVHRPPKPSRHLSHRSSTSIEMPESMTECLMRLTSKDWRLRIEALQKIESLASKLRQMNERDLLNVMDQLTYRLHDGNAKVILVALETLKTVFEKKGKGVVPTLTTVIPAIAANLASASDKIRSAADDALDRLIDSVDGVYLVQNLSHCCTHGNPRIKATLLQKLDRVMPSVHARKPQFTNKYILPVAFSSLSDIRLDVREANAHLLRGLAQMTGRSFIEKAEALTGTSRQRLLDIVQGSF